MRPVCRSAPARPPLTPTCQARCVPTARRSLSVGSAVSVRRAAVAPPPRPRARASHVGAGGSGGTTEPVVPGAQPAQGVVGEPQAEVAAAAVAPEELESLEEAAIAGEDEGRRPTDYDRRAHIFEESSRVFRELKQRRDHGDGDARGGGVQVQGGDGTAAETGEASVRPD